MAAEKARRHLDEVERLRADLDRATQEAEAVETVMADRLTFVEQGGRHREAIENDLADLRARTALASSAGAIAGFQRRYREKQTLLKEYERDVAEEAARLDTLRHAAREKARMVKQIREAISRHLALLSSLVEGTEAPAAPARLAEAPLVGAPGRPVRRVVRRIRRRR